MQTREWPAGIIVCNSAGVVKGEGSLFMQIFPVSRPRVSICNPTTRNCIFTLDTTSAEAQNPRNFSVCCSIERGDSHPPRRRRTACNICLVGLCNASIRNVPREATGSAWTLREEKFAATVTRRFATYRPRWLPACGCDLARWAAIVRRDVPRDVRASRNSRAFGPARLDPAGRAVPADFSSFPGRFPGCQ